MAQRDWDKNAVDNVTAPMYCLFEKQNSNSAQNGQENAVAHVTATTTLLIWQISTKQPQAAQTT